MDRKYCMLLYSIYSPASKNLIEYIRSLPFDFSSLTGLTIVNIDNSEFKDILYKNDINYVPTILIEYYDGTKQKFVNNDIYLWINQMFQIMNTQKTEPFEKQDDYNNGHIENDNQNSVQDPRISNSVLSSHKSDSVEHNNGPKSARELKSEEISSKALQLQQSREQYFEKNKPNFGL